MSGYIESEAEESEVSFFSSCSALPHSNSTLMQKIALYLYAFQAQDYSMVIIDMSIY